MSGSAKLALTLLLAVFAVWALYHVVSFIIVKVLSLLIPLALCVAVVMVLVYFINRKALGPGNRRILP